MVWKRGGWNGLCSRGKDNPDTNNEILLFPPFFGSNTIDSRILCHEIAQSYEHLLIENLILSGLPEKKKVKKKSLK